MERARKLIHPYLQMDGVIGIYVVGSATRPYRDSLSDYDIEVIVEDDIYAQTPMEDRQVFYYKDDDSKIVDYEFYLIPWSDFINLTKSGLDLFHYPYQHAVILHDPQERLAPVIAQLAELPEELRIERMTVHFLEFLYRLGRGRKTANRGHWPINQALLQGDAVGSLVKVIFLANKSWPSMKHWTEQEFQAMGVSSDLLDSVNTWISDPKTDHARSMVNATRAFLDAQGETFHHDMEGIQQWLFFTQEGKAAFEKWGCR